MPLFIEEEEEYTVVPKMDEMCGRGLIRQDHKWGGEERRKKRLYLTLPQILLQDRKGDMMMEGLAVSMVLLIGITINAAHAQGKRVVAWQLFQWIPVGN